MCYECVWEGGGGDYGNIISHTQMKILEHMHKARAICSSPERVIAVNTVRL